jgi:hypothetical protein
MSNQRSPGRGVLKAEEEILEVISKVAFPEKNIVL